MNIKSYSFYPIDAKMYLLVENHRAVILDPCVSEEAKEYLQSENVEEIIVLLTHEHYDHISGINWLRESFKRTKVNVEQRLETPIKICLNITRFYFRVRMKKHRSM